MMAAFGERFSSLDDRSSQCIHRMCYDCLPPCRLKLCGVMDCRASDPYGRSTSDTYLGFAGATEQIGSALMQSCRRHHYTADISADEKTSAKSESIAILCRERTRVV